MGSLNIHLSFVTFLICISITLNLLNLNHNPPTSIVVDI
jgi:hypothetical protein